MWRRALLAAAALSCTLSTRTQAHRTQIQDIICVLVMSGMQKEDLDVSMLRKLQRYDVNIDDINNEELRKHCLSENNGFTTDIKKDNTIVSTTEQDKSTITTEIPLSASLSIDTIINYLKRRQNSDTHFDETTTIKTTTVLTNTEKVTTTELPENQSNIDMTLLRRYIELETQNKSTYKRDDNSESTKHTGTIHFKTNEMNPTKVEDLALIDKLFKGYLFHKQNILTTTTTEYTTKFTLDIQSIYKQIDDIMAKNSNAELIDNKANHKTLHESVINDAHELNTNPVTVLPLDQNNSNLGENQLLKTFYNFLNEMKQLRNDSRQSIPSKPLSVQPSNLAKQFIQNREETYKDTTTYESKAKNAPNPQALTPNLVKEIAETVKEVIIKDLRHELSDIYLKPTYSTTENTPPTTKTTTEIIPLTRPHKNIIQEGNTSLMDKFMELYEEMKSLKQATFSLKPNNESEILNNDLKQKIQSPVRSALTMPIVQKLQIPETPVYITSNGKYNTKQSFNQDPYVPMTSNGRALPITIQTNSVEIQPLAVSISKPQSLIRQNIVVDSGYHFQGRYHPKEVNVRDRHPAIQITHKNRTYYTPMKLQDRHYSAYKPLHHNSQESKQKEDVIRFRMRNNGNSEYDMDYYEKINFDNEYERAHAKRGSYINNYMPRFHEKLEETDTGLNRIAFITNNDKTEKREQENVDVPSRQQLSLVDMKKGSTYNDTHFKNFLKTQQKVTDILERILATRPKTNTPRSVEAV